MNQQEYLNTKRTIEEWCEPNEIYDATLICASIGYLATRNDKKSRLDFYVMKDSLFPPQTIDDFVWIGFLDYFLLEDNPSEIEELFVKHLFDSIGLSNHNL